MVSGFHGQSSHSFRSVSTVLSDIVFTCDSPESEVSLICKKMLRRFPLNVRAVSAKIKLPKKYFQHCHILRTDKKNLSLLLLPN